MIRTDHEYEVAVRRVQQQRERLRQQKESFAAEGLTAREVSRALQPQESFLAGLEDEVADYERLKRGQFGTVDDLHAIGPLLVRLRVAKGLSQRELAELLNVDPSQVSRDERNDYHGITLDRAARIMHALGYQLSAEVRDTRSEQTTA